MKRTGRVLLDGFLTGAAAPASVGVAEAGSPDGAGGDAADRGHSADSGPSEDGGPAEGSGPTGSGRATPTIPIARNSVECTTTIRRITAKQCAGLCADFALGGIPGVGAVLVVRPGQNATSRMQYG